MKTQRWMQGGLLALAVLVGGLSGQAGAQVPPVTTSVVRSTPIAGEARDQVVASVVETGVRASVNQLVTLQLVNSVTGVVVAQTHGVLTETTPLRLSYRALVADTLYARAIAYQSSTPRLVAILTVERWSPVAPSPWSEPSVCYWELEQMEKDEMPEPERPTVPTTMQVLKCIPVVHSAH
ncbi:hypothetical protein HUA74_24660 [Myxococcus sp. CA051A]|uniref:hypothetical protein n=1 Tax=Myxococcus sp. CA051A TaxID=2741739 RepID=UPI00157B848A|nr:hypothetical protein [Myxococcus sp. CA051A]NTX63855.1 hypothetical protein [Myxococcus sp. CA051A]